MNQGRLRMQKTKEKHPSDWLRQQNWGHWWRLQPKWRGTRKLPSFFFFFFLWMKAVYTADVWRLGGDQICTSPSWYDKKTPCNSIFFKLAQHQNYPAAPVATRSRRTPWKRHKTGKWNQIKEEDFPEPKPPVHPGLAIFISSNFPIWDF